MNTYKKKRKYRKSLKRTHKKRINKTKKRKTKKNIRGGEPTQSELELMRKNLNPVVTTSSNPQMMTNPQMVTNPQMISDPQMMTNPQMISDPQMMNSPLSNQGVMPDIRLTQSGNIPTPPQDGISNRGKGLVEELKQKYAMNQQNIALSKNQGILSREQLMDYLEDFKRQIKEIININPDEDKDISDIQAKKILEALSSHRAKIGGLQHTLYRQNRKLLNEIESEKRRLEAKFSNLEKKVEKEIQKLKKENSPRRSSEKSARRSSEKSRRRSSEKSARRSSEKSAGRYSEKSPRRSSEKSPRRSYRESKESPYV